MYYKKLLCMFFAVVFLLSSASVAVGQREGIKKLRSSDFDFNFGNARPLTKLSGLIERVRERLTERLGLSRSGGIVEDIIEEDPAEEVIPPKEEPETEPEEKIPEEEEEKPDEKKEPEEEKKEEKTVELVLSIENVEVDEQISSNSIYLTVSLTNKGEYPVSILNLESNSLSFNIIVPDGTEIVYNNGLSKESSSYITISPGEIISADVDLKDDNKDFSTSGIYKIQARYYSSIDSYDGNREPLEIDLSSPESTFEINLDKTTVDSMNSFSFKLLEEFMSYGDTNRRTGGLIGEFSINPTLYGIYFANLLLGVAGENAQEISDVLGIDKTDEDVLKTMKTLQDNYLNHKNDLYETSQDNAIWFNELYQDYISQNYLDSINEYYDCSDYYLNLNFSNQKTVNNFFEFIDVMNGWFEDKTNGRIKNMFRKVFPRGMNERGMGSGIDIDIPDYRNFTLIDSSSTMCFDGKWEKSFETENGIFHGSRQNPRAVTYLRYDGCYPNLGYVNEPEMKVLEIPYKGDDISMMFMLPNYEDGYDLSDISDKMNKKYFEELRESLSEFRWQDSPIDIYIPEFETGSSNSILSLYDMTEYIKNIGITNIFSEEDSDFSNMFSQNLPKVDNTYLENLYHKSYIKIDKFGTETADAIDFFSLPYQGSNERRILPEREEIPQTDDEVSGSETLSYHGISSDSIEFKANQPFAGILYNKKTGNILKYFDVDIIIISPLVLDLDSNGIETSDIDNGVLFDLNCDGKKDITAWTVAGSDDSFLALDINGNGFIDDGSELFGDYTILPAGKNALNGFQALAQYDSNNDKVIDCKDEIWPDLLLWCDSNHNGISEKDELTPITESQVKEIYLNYGYLDRWDNGNLLRECSFFKNRDESIGLIIDIWFQAIT